MIISIIQNKTMMIKYPQVKKCTFGGFAPIVHNETDDI